MELHLWSTTLGSTSASTPCSWESARWWSPSPSLISWWRSKGGKLVSSAVASLASLDSLFCSRSLTPRPPPAQSWSLSWGSLEVVDCLFSNWINDGHLDPNRILPCVDPVHWSWLNRGHRPDRLLYFTYFGDSCHQHGNWTNGVASWGTNDTAVSLEIYTGDIQEGSPNTSKWRINEGIDPIHPMRYCISTLEYPKYHEPNF